MKTFCKQASASQPRKQRDRRRRVGECCNLCESRDLLALTLIHISIYKLIKTKSIIKTKLSSAHPVSLKPAYRSGRGAARISAFKFKYSLFILLSTFIINCEAAQKTWTGTTDTAWTTASNWSPGGVPASTDTVTIVTGSNQCHLTQNTTVNRITLTSGTLQLHGFTLTVNNHSTFNGGTVSGTANPALILRGTRTTFAGTTVNAIVETISNRVELNGSTFNNKCYLEQTGGTTSNGTGSNTFNDTVTLANSGTANFNLAQNTGDTYNALLKVYMTGTHDLVVSKKTSYFNGNIELNMSGSGEIYLGTSDGDSSYLASGKTISAGDSGITGGVVIFNKFVQQGNTSQTLTATSNGSSGNGVFNMISSVFNGALNVTAPVPLFKNNVFYGALNVTKTTNISALSDGGNRFYGDVTIDNNSVQQVRMANSTRDKYYGNVSFIGSSTGVIRPFYNDTTEMHGNLGVTSNKVELDANNGIVRFAGSNNQTVSGNLTVKFKNPIIEKTGGHVTLDTSVSVSGTLKLVSGNIITTSAHLLTMLAGSSVTGASNSSFVSGPVKKVGNTAFTFPTGKGSSYRAVEISAPSNSTDAFTGEYFDTGLALGSSMDTTIDYLSDCNYWNLTRNTGSSNVYVSLYWDTTACGPTNRVSTMIVSNWQSSVWQDRGQDTILGDYALGCVKSLTSQSNFGYFTWGLPRLVVPDCTLPTPNPSGCILELICNGGFEQHLADPNLTLLGSFSLQNTGNNISLVVNWEDFTSPTNFASTCDFFLDGTTLSPNYGIPNNFITSNCNPSVSLLAHSANNNVYIGMQLGEGLVTNLISPVTPGVDYQLQFWISLFDRPCSSPSIAFTADLIIELLPDFPSWAMQPRFTVGQFSINSHNSTGGPWFLTTVNFRIDPLLGLPPLENLIIRAVPNLTSEGKIPYFFIDDVSLTTTQLTSFTNEPPCIDEPTQFNCFANTAGITYAWDFGDGNTSNLQSPQHTYTTPGYYVVTLAVTTPASCTDCFTKTIYVSPSCCAVDGSIVYDNFVTVPPHVTTNSTWNQNFRLNRTITVDPDVTLTVQQGTVIEFGPEGRIVVDRGDPTNPNITGAILNLETGSRLTSVTNTDQGCPVMWQGVEVWGHNNINHGNATNRARHGRVNMEMNATIEFAHNGVLLGRTQYIFDDPCGPPPQNDENYPPYDFAYDGGILRADRGLFLKNGVSIRMLPFRFWNFTDVDGCEFNGGELPDIHYNTGSSYYYSASNSPNRNPHYGEANKFGRSAIGIYQWQIRNINFTENTFDDIQVGMQSFDARYIVASSSFNNHQYGIDIQSSNRSSLSNGHTITGNTFTQISKDLGFNSPSSVWALNAGLRINGGINDFIHTDNRFGDLSFNPNSHEQPFDFVGIQLFRSDNFNISDNQFRGIGFGIHTNKSAAHFGIIGYINSGNLFEENQWGINSMANNPMLAVRCNNFVSQSPGAAGYKWCWRNVGILPTSQGQQSPTNDKLPAGNEWNKADNTTRKDIISNFAYVYESHEEDVGGQHPSVVPEPWTSTITVHQNIGNLKNSTSCEQEFCDPCDRQETYDILDSLKIIAETFILESEEIQQAIDEGKTEDLLHLIDSEEISSEQLRDSLLEYSLLSDSVLIAYFNRTYDVAEEDMRDVLQVNMPVSPRVFDQLLTRLESFTEEEIKIQIMSWQAFNEYARTETSIQRELVTVQLQRNGLLTSLLRELSDADSISKIITILTEESNKVMFYALISTLISVDSLSLASDLMNESNYDDDEFNDWKLVMQKLIELAETGKSVFELSLEEIEDLMEIAEKENPDLASSHAQAILRLVKGLDFGGGEFVWSEPERKSSQAESIQSISNQIDNKNFIKAIIPNPASETFILKYELEVDVSALVNITDIAGKEIKSVKLDAQKNSMHFTTYGIANGVYFLTLNISGCKMKTYKLVIQK